jgi:hypothetical protein
MDLKSLTQKKLTKEELQSIKAGTAPDCEPGFIRVPYKSTTVCMPLAGCNEP